MKNILLFLALILILTACCIHSKSDKIVSDVVPNIIARDTLEPAFIDTLLLGDINADGIEDTAFVYTPATIRNFNDDDSTYFLFGCLNNECDNRLTFSCDLPELVNYNSVWARVEFIDDLDGDGIREVLVAPNWFWSCVGSLKLYSLKSNKWEEIQSVPFRRCTDEPLRSFLVKRKKKLFLQGMDWVDGDQETLYKEIIFSKR